MTIDQVSQAIGKLQADAEAAQRQRSDLFFRTTEIKEDIAEIKQLLTGHITHVNDTLTHHAKKLESNNENISTLNQFKTRVYILLAGVGGTGGVGGWLASKLGSGELN